MAAYRRNSSQQGVTTYLAVLSDEPMSWHHCMECSGTRRGLRHYWTTAQRGGNRKGRGRADVVVVAAAECGRGPGVLVGRAGAAACGSQRGRSHLGRWRRCGAGRGAGPGPWAHTGGTGNMASLYLTTIRHGNQEQGQAFKLATMVTRGPT